MKKMDKIIKTIYTILLIITALGSTLALVEHITQFYGNQVFRFLINLGSITYALIIYSIIPYYIYLIVSKNKITKIIKSIVATIIVIFIFIYVNATTSINLVKKPMIYIYPEEDNKELVIKFENKELLTTTYPKYEDGWEIIVNKDGNIYDKNTSRNYYGLYWEGKDNSKINTKEGFVVSGENTTKFLEEKLEILGLNEREINEFIIYWLPKMEHNKYNYIRFRTVEEMNQYMPINVNQKVDTLIRVSMDFKPLNKKLTVKEQKLTKVERKGFTIVEWGGREIN